MTAHGRGDPPPTGPIPPPEVVSRSTLYKGKKFAFDVLSVRRPIPARPSSGPAGGPGGGGGGGGGGAVAFGRPFEWAMIRHPGAVVVVPILPDNRIVLIRNYRLSVAGELVECCAGTIEPPEPPEVCAARELEEETGYRAARLIALGWFYTTPGMTDERMYAFAATGLTHVGQRLEEDETIDVFTVDAHDALAMARDGRIKDAKSMLALHAAHQAGLLT